MRVALRISAVIAVICFTILWYLGLSASTPAITDAAGNELPGSIASLERINLGELDQWILIRGADRSNPILLWLHGGPGSAQMPLAHHLDRKLEQHFVVVHWDQRGAGKSNHGGFDERTMRLDQYVADARELIEHLRDRFNRERIVLLGHSWGTQIGLDLVAAHPEYFSAYVGVSQTINHERATEIARDWLQTQIDPETAPEDARALAAIEFPARRHSDYRALQSLVNRYGGSFDTSLTTLARIALRAPEYTAIDYLRLVRGMNRGGRPMHAGGIMAGYDHIARFPVLDVPVYFFSGENDYNTPLSLVQAYFDTLTAPYKAIVAFEDSAHLPFVAEPEKFTQEILRITR